MLGPLQPEKLVEQEVLNRVCMRSSRRQNQIKIGKGISACSVNLFGAREERDGRLRGERDGRLEQIASNEPCWKHCQKQRAGSAGLQEQRSAGCLLFAHREHPLLPVAQGIAYFPAAAKDEWSFGLSEGVLLDAANEDRLAGSLSQLLKTWHTSLWFAPSLLGISLKVEPGMQVGSLRSCVFLQVPLKCLIFKESLCKQCMLEHDGFVQMYLPS
ncbi:uncharacterized protein LOC118162611 [Oxyura jamaicensis]|uniref:uncharacterized protein LOC118162611 n=1 Tax=Oxyura jamaicensis TaxID=8884 RepID=UPI0015A5EF39|nr:uncharacterized protein LOC118162611 [Oxyura jamaicensis]XP_035174801.1 uncharacterized protein LOC118162611 [Oxyura jamaicensis]